MSSRTRATTARSPVRLFRNDWSRLSPPEPGEWQPSRSVSLIIPAHDCQRSLDLTLAALSTQTYPSGLLEVVVVDDGSDPPLVLPRLRPENCRLLRLAEHGDGWGRSAALHAGATRSEGEILHWLDADMVVFPEHVAAQARWQHVSDEAVTLGYKRFVEADWPTPEQVAESCAGGTADQLFRLDDSEPHEYVERLIDATDQLRGGDHLNFRAHVGATAALSRGLYTETGGLNPGLRLGEDTEFGYRLAQAGAVFVPEPRARSWHLGRSHMMTRGEALRRYNRPFLADLMPQPRYLRAAAQRGWAVPLVVAVVRADGPYEMVRTCVDRLLAGDQTDLRVVLVAHWAELTDDRRPVLADPLLDRRLLAATYRSEPRVELAEEPPRTAYPAAYLLEVGSHLGVDGDTVRRLVAVADQWQVGLLRVLPVGAATPDDGLSLWRTSALSRALRVRGPAEELAEVVAEVAGRRWVSGDDFGVVDLRLLPESSWVSPRPRQVVRPDRRARRAALAGVETIPVGGIRSLATATRFVAGRYAGLAADRLRQRVRRPAAPAD
ncbi:glycosyltransferase [Micromonospora sp. WMMD1102]|uniref:glycosyltransferase n=1 Tax=Micromonospora sp. WMMD1102 TaxID=3016105 RepID=UPI0024152BCD|nr:glycosyltransferase [Micromonospora sp. WMMD1102]MDG4790306.1 glycosyltransferase [Micromonospora sp. WMMD1102]